MAQIELEPHFRQALIDLLIEIRETHELEHRDVGKPLGLSATAIGKAENPDLPRVDPRAIAAYAVHDPDAAQVIIEMLAVPGRSALIAEFERRDVAFRLPLGPDRLPVTRRTSEAFATLLRGEREFRGVAIDDIAAVARARTEVVDAFERGSNPRPPYSVVAAYANRLGWDLEDLSLPVLHPSTVTRIRDLSERPRPRLLPADLALRVDLAAAIRTGVALSNWSVRDAVAEARVPRDLWRRLSETRRFEGPATVAAVGRLAAVASIDFESVAWPDLKTRGFVESAAEGWSRRLRTSTRRDSANVAIPALPDTLALRQSPAPTRGDLSR